MSKPRPIIMIRRGYSCIYGTLAQAEQASGISRSKILTALRSVDGAVRGDPYTQFDDALLTEEDQDAIVKDALAKVEDFDEKPQSKKGM